MRYLLLGLSLLFSTNVKAVVPDEFWDRLALRNETFSILSIKYADAQARERIVHLVSGSADLPFINRVVVRIERERALSLQGDPDIVDVEVFGSASADRTFHKLLELYRVYLYQVSGRFNISALNFSQNVNYFDRNSQERGDRTIAEALEILGSRIVPSFVAVGDGANFGVGSWAKAQSVIPVVATMHGGSSIMSNSARPARENAVWPLVLYADGEPATGLDEASRAPACGEGSHLTADQMIHPESARVPAPGGSSYATFKATSSLCPIQQYTELLRVMLRARTPVGFVEVEPFVAYYVDSPVNRECPALNYRWADQRLQFGAPKYAISAEDKLRLDSFVSGNSIELRPNYSIPLAKAFLSQLPELHMTDAGVKERSVSHLQVLEMLRAFRFSDLLEVAANKRNIRFSQWKNLAERYDRPIIDARLIDAIQSYCENQSLFLVLSDEEKPFFDAME
ncbi:hypothetical protein ELH79_09400 [Rhizobium leguminosarum]|uniref:hypothetical protein n=1 Tax=Rhizobium leguminosarum TaxID=384 RepID=UPI0010D22BC5|nr:hypothetical protein [Rhizobium leguminosarum]TAY98663.1 hypothetical protein ELH79_09400 [Rhizobium leguminosarum]TAZ09428.1 hypothetical protein ELH78_09400 [Rhizobium leguminosarum]